MTAIALDNMVIEHRRGDTYPVMIVTDGTGAFVELYVAKDPREAFFRLSQLGQATSLMQAVMPPAAPSGSFDNQEQ